MEREVQKCDRRLFVILLAAVVVGERRIELQLMEKSRLDLEDQPN